MHTFYNYIKKSFFQDLTLDYALSRQMNKPLRPLDHLHL